MNILAFAGQLDEHYQEERELYTYIHGNLYVYVCDWMRSSVARILLCAQIN